MTTDIEYEFYNRYDLVTKYTQKEYVNILERINTRNIPKKKAQRDRSYIKRDFTKNKNASRNTKHLCMCNPFVNI